MKLAILLIFIIKYYWVIPLISLVVLIFAIAGKLSLFWMIPLVLLSLISVSIKFLTNDADEWR